MSAIKRRAVISGLLGATASCVGKVALDPTSPVQSSARGLCHRFVPADAAIISALNAAIAISLPSGQVCKSIELSLRGVCLLLMIGTNAATMATFLEGMNDSGTVAGTALANAANFSLSAIYGMVFFEESITTLWMVGFAMILVGAWILSSIQLKDTLQEENQNNMRAGEKAVASDFRRRGRGPSVATMMPMVATLLATATAFQIKASVSIPRMSHLAEDSAINKHEGRDEMISRLVAEKLKRIATGFQTHGEEMKRTLETELELSNKVEKCFFGGACPHISNLLLSSKLVVKQRLLEESLEVNGQVVRQLLATPDGSKQLFQSIDFVPSAAVQGNDEHDDLGQLMGNGGMIKVAEEAKEIEGYDTALQVIHHTSRDWTAGSAPCREKTIGWIVSAIKEYAGARAQLRVLVPGAGLGRLAFDISTCRDLVEGGDVHVEANDSSVTMAFAARQVLHMLQQRHEQQNQLRSTILPFLSDPRINEVDISKRFEKYVFPDSEAVNCYGRYYEVKGEKPNLSFTVGDFVSTYSQQAQRSQYDVIATSFFIDTATNIYEYVFIMKHLLDSDAQSPSIWINCGPVQWHPCALLRPTVEELKDILEAAGFELLTWQVSEEAVAYKHPDEMGGSGMKPRYTRSEAYRPLRFAVRLKAGVGVDADKINIADLPLKVQYSEHLNEIANGRVKAVD